MARFLARAINGNVGKMLKSKESNFLRSLGFSSLIFKKNPTKHNLPASAHLAKEKSTLSDLEECKLRLHLEDSMRNVAGVYGVSSFDKTNKIVKVVREVPGEKIKITFKMQHFVEECDEDWSKNEFIDRFYESDPRNSYNFFDIFKDQMKADFLIKTPKPSFIVEIDKGGSDFLMIKCALCKPQELKKTGKKFQVISFGYGLKLKVDGTAEAKPMSEINALKDTADFKELTEILNTKGITDELIEKIRDWCQHFNPTKLEEVYGLNHLRQFIK